MPVLVPEWNKYQYRNQFATRIKGTSPALECSSTELKWWIPEYWCQRHQVRCQCPAMLIGCNAACYFRCITSASIPADALLMLLFMVLLLPLPHCRCHRFPFFRSNLLLWSTAGVPSVVSSGLPIVVGFPWYSGFQFFVAGGPNVAVVLLLLIPHVSLLRLESLCCYQNSHGSVSYLTQKSVNRQHRWEVTTVAGSLKMNTALEYSTRVVQEGGRRWKKSTLNDLVHLTPLRIPLMNPPDIYSILI